MTHATTLELEQYVAATLAEERSAWLEQHCEGCAECAAAVAVEARLEVTVRAMAAERRCGRSEAAPIEPAPVPSTPRFYAVAAAAALAFVFAVVGHVPRAPAAAPPVMLADAGDFVKPEASHPAWAAGSPSGGTP